MRWVLLILAAAISVRADCLKVAGDRVTAADLARIDPAWANVPGEQVLGYAPKIGARRIVEPVEWQRWSGRAGVAAMPAQPLCLERLSRYWTREEIERAIEQSGSGSVRVIDFCRLATAPGELEFRLADLTAKGNQQTVVWRGAVRHPDGSRTPFWSRVEILATHDELVATTDLPAGSPIQADQLTVQQAPGFGGQTLSLSPAQAVGRVPRRLIRKGQFLSAGVLTDPPTVRRGQLLEVQIATGSGQVVVQGIARTAGKAGEPIVVQNPATAKVYRGIVTQPGVVEVKLTEEH